MIRVGFLVAWLLPAVATASVATKGPLEFSSHLLELPGKVELTYYADVDRDGLWDVLAVWRGDRFDDPPRNLAVFLQRTGGFPARPDVTWRIPDDVAVIDLGDVDPASPGEELLMMTGSAVRWIPLAAGAERPEGGFPLVEVDPLFAHAERLNLAKRDFARPVDDGETATLLIPRTEGYRIFYPDDGYTTGHDFPTPHSHGVSGDAYHVSTAEAHLADMDGDGQNDLVFTYLDRVHGFYQTDGRFSAEPGLDRNLEILSAADRESPMDLDEIIGFTIEDFDADGLADLFVRKTLIRRKAVVNDKQQYQLYHNRGGRFELMPDQAFILKSFDEPGTMDLNGDGRLDLVTGYFEFSLGNIVKALLSKRFSIDLSFFLQRAEGFPDQPDEQRDFKIRISLSNLDENFAPAVETDGDYDGDGHLDFLMQTEDRKIEIFLADPEDDGRLFEKKSSVHLEAVACDNSHVEDMNGDGRADLAFDRFPDREPYQPNWIHVLLSQPSRP